MEAQSVVDRRVVVFAAVVAFVLCLRCVAAVGVLVVFDVGLYMLI